MPSSGVGNMREIIFKLVVCAYLVAIVCFSTFSKAADADKYSCENYVAQGWCSNSNYIYSSAQAAANVVIKAYIAQQMKDYSDITYTFGACEVYAGMDMYRQCIAQLVFYKLDKEGKSSIFLKQPLPILINKQQIEEVVCNDTAELKGSLGSVIVSGTKKYVLSRNPGDNICTNNCKYNSPKSVDCYLVTGKTNEGFCNYEYKAELDSSGKKQSCESDPALEEGDEGDPLDGKEEPPQTPDPGGEEGGEGDGSGTGNGNGDDSGTGTGDGSGSGPGSGSGDGSGTGSGTGSGSGGTGGTGGETGSGGNTGGGTSPGGSTGGDGSSGGPDGNGSDGGTEESFKSPGDLDLNGKNDQRGAEVKKQFSDFKSNIDSSRTFESLNKAFGGSSHSSAACPTGSVFLFGQNIVFDSHCDLFAMIAPILRMVFIAVWMLFAARIVLSA